MTLETDRLFIKRPEVGFAHAVASFYTRNKTFFALSQPARDEYFFTREYWHENLANLQTSFANNTQYQFYLFEKNNPDIIIGQTNISGIQRGPFQACFLGYQLDEQKNGLGLMNEALDSVITWLFQEKHMHRIMANYMPSNERSASLLKALGFSVEGYARDYLHLNGQWQDHILTALINDEYSAKG
ncbi:ribosomal-protein-alanine N-acetyltransferase [Pseudoalteromonas sp. A25]|uniref:GNAT family N-acetyltransferase n=1 Tax=Pseudoalteromonas sp. A25 TaxID=116092 RepID=UPI0012611C63|nr:GNAT family N-acetyltransferase [Pseudoalteromonas sp. A25]BBN83141.1 ribosomal-protein-alanine N-acetyltransferase [Pseudoalteromonas sp. A25]